jgi:hypothetical protein
MPDVPTENRAIACGLLSSGTIAALGSSIGVLTLLRIEQRIAGGKALSARTLMARRTLMAAGMRTMKESKAR